jgi:hypothetical protein
MQHQQRGCSAKDAMGFGRTMPSDQTTYLGFSWAISLNLFEIVYENE